MIERSGACAWNGAGNQPRALALRKARVENRQLERKRAGVEIGQMAGGGRNSE
jgi:hypothetical protein